MLLFRGKLGVQQQAGHADHAVHRRSNFMAHVGQKFAFRGIGHLRLHRHFIGSGRGFFKPAVGLQQFLFGLFTGFEIVNHPDDASVQVLGIQGLS